MPPFPSRILVNGDSGSGKSFLTSLIVEQLADLKYASLVIDPEADHAALSGLPGVMNVGRDGYLPPPGVLVDLLVHGPGTLVLDLSQERLDDVSPLRSDALAAGLRDYFTHLADAIQDSRRQAGRPHWLVVDEADSLLTHGGPLLPLASHDWGLCLTTYRPDRLPPDCTQTCSGRCAWTGRPPVRRPSSRVTPRLLPSDSPLRHGGRPHVRHQREYADGSTPNDRPLFSEPRGNRRCHRSQLP